MRAAESALIVPVSEAEAVVGDVRSAHDPVAPAGIPAHITVLYPFKDPTAIDSEIIDELGAILRGVEPFSFQLVSIARFPEVVYLVPEPGEPFVRLTAAIATRWPDTPPYEGTFDRVIPHLTVAHTDDPATISDIHRRLGPSLPITGRAHEARLLTSRNGRWSVRETFPFSTEGS
jgi:2'-5' RNA ligase